MLHLAVRGLSATLLLTLIYLFCLESSAAASLAKCQKWIDGYGKEYVEKSGKIRAENERHINQAIESYVGRFPVEDGSAENMRQILQREYERHNLDRTRQRDVDGEIERVRELYLSDDNLWACNRRAINYEFDDALDAYKAAIQKARDDVQNRIDINDLDEDEGLIVAAVVVSGRADVVRISRLGSIGSTVKLGPIRTGEYFEVLKVRKGRYAWNSVWNFTFNGRHIFNYADREYDFVVQAGRINHIGVFSFELVNWGYGLAELYNRPAVILSKLEHRHPELLEKFEFGNGLYPDDRFIEFYMEEKRNAGSMADAAP
jgi:hypothetical protein